MRAEAIRDFTYRGQPRKVGEQFDIDDQDEPLLARSVMPSIKVVEQKLPEIPKIETAELKAVATDMPENRQRRRYMRRDMTPQE